MEVYGDSYETAKKNVRHSDEARSSYYKKISGKAWGDRRNYHLMVDSSMGVEKSADMIYSFVKAFTK